MPYATEGGSVEVTSASTTHVTGNLYSLNGGSIKADFDGGSSFLKGTSFTNAETDLSFTNGKPGR